MNKGLYTDVFWPVHRKGCILNWEGVSQFNSGEKVAGRYGCTGNDIYRIGDKMGTKYQYLPTSTVYSETNRYTAF